MAKKTNTDILLEMDYNTLVNLTKKENIDSLRSVVKQLTSTANRRINALNKDEVGKYSPALKNLNEHSKGFKTSKIKTMTSNELMHQYATVRKFLNAKSSKLTGWYDIRSKIAKRTGAKKLFQKEYKSKRSATIWHNREKRFWKLYNDLVDNFGGIISQLDSERIQAMLMRVQTMKGTRKSDEDISEIMNTYIEKLYESANKGEDLSDEDFEEEIRISYSK